MRDHERIAALLHGRLTQDLFTTSMGLANLASAETRPDHRKSLLALMDSIDATIGRIHGAAFQITQGVDGPPDR